MFSSDSKGLNITKMLFFLWLAFTTLYVVYSEYSRLNGYVARVAYENGVKNTVIQIINESKACQPLPLKAEGLSADMINVECLNPSPTDQ